jgi:hypothetical protein
MKSRTGFGCVNRADVAGRMRLSSTDQTGAEGLLATKDLRVSQHPHDHRAAAHQTNARVSDAVGADPWTHAAERISWVCARDRAPCARRTLTPLSGKPEPPPHSSKGLISAGGWTRALSANGLAMRMKETAAVAEGSGALEVIATAEQSPACPQRCRNATRSWLPTISMLFVRAKAVCLARSLTAIKSA